jgi:hypothetical protein
MLYEPVDRDAVKRRLPLLEQRLAPTLRVLQVFGFFPLCIDVTATCVRRRLEFLFWTLLVVALLALNAFFVKLNIETTWMYSLMFEWLHAQTICSIINGLKPLIAAMSMSIFWIQASRSSSTRWANEKCKFCFNRCSFANHYWIKLKFGTHTPKINLKDKIFTLTDCLQLVKCKKLLSLVPSTKKIEQKMTHLTYKLNATNTCKILYHFNVNVLGTCVPNFSSI